MSSVSGLCIQCYRFRSDLGTSLVAKPSDLELRSLTNSIQSVNSAQQVCLFGMQDVTGPGRPCSVKWTLESSSLLESNKNIFNTDISRTIPRTVPSPASFYCGRPRTD